MSRICRVVAIIMALDVIMFRSILADEDVICEKKR